MLNRNQHDQPNLQNYNIGTDSVLNAIIEHPGSYVPTPKNVFLLTDGTPILLTNGSNLLLSA